MSYFRVAPGVLGSAASDLTGIGSALAQAHAAAALSTTCVVSAAADEVSAAVAALVSSHGLQFQALGAQAAAFHTEFVQALSGAGNAYTAAEAGNVAPLAAAVQQAQSLGAFSPILDLTGPEPAPPAPVVVVGAAAPLQSPAIWATVAPATVVPTAAEVAKAA